MENNNNKGKKPLDLTLKLGPSSPEEQMPEENQDAAGNNERHGPSSMDDLSLRLGEGNIGNADQFNHGTNEVGPPANFLFYQAGYPPLDHGSPNRTRPTTANDDVRVCRMCGCNSTPLWRRGPDGPQTLCNACGLKHMRAEKRVAE